MYRTKNLKNEKIKEIKHKNDTVKCILKPNKSLIIKGIYKMLYYIINGKIN